MIFGRSCIRFAMIIFILKAASNTEFKVMDHKKEIAPVSSRARKQRHKSKAFSSSRLCPNELGVADLYWGIDSCTFYMAPLGVARIRQWRKTAGSSKQCVNTMLRVGFLLAFFLPLQNFLSLFIPEINCFPCFLNRNLGMKMATWEFQFTLHEIWIIRLLKVIMSKNLDWIHKKLKGN